MGHGRQRVAVQMPNPRERTASSMLATFGRNDLTRVLSKGAGHEHS
jgi:hypothetical protein